MTVLRFYLPSECDGLGVPLDWERCRRCSGLGYLPSIDPTFPATVSPGNPCERCGGMGSLKAAALRHLAVIGRTRTWTTPDHAPRCEGCAHPASDGTWVSPMGAPGWGPPDPAEHVSYLAAVRQWLAHHDTDPLWAWVHYSPCDAECRHPTVRADEDRVLAGTNEASWRAVEVRCLSWPHDLRPEQLAVLCLRCWATKGATT